MAITLSVYGFGVYFSPVGGSLTAPQHAATPVVVVSKQQSGPWQENLLMVLPVVNSITELLAAVHYHFMMSL